jgi:hypothetical protein
VGEQEYQKSNLGIKFPNSTLESQCNKSLQKKERRRKENHRRNPFYSDPLRATKPLLDF